MPLAASITREACKRRLHELLNICSQQNSQLDGLFPHINAQLDNILLKVKANTTTTHTTTSFVTKEVVPPNKHNVTQPRFSATAKKPGRHTSGVTFR